MLNIPGITQEPDYKRLLQESLITASDVIEKPPVCLEIHRGDIVSAIATLGNISMFIGKAKQGKTFAVSMALAAASKDDLFQNTLRATLPDDQKRIVLFDTEQSNYHTQRVVKRICNLLDVEEPPNLSVYALRKYPPDQRLALVEYFIYNTPNLGIVVIDGIRDLVSSINDEEQATMISSKLLQWTAEKNIHIITVLHMNKGDQNARGHLGTELTNKCETVISVGKNSSNKDVIIVQPEFTRDKDFEPFGFSINENGLPYILEEWTAETSKVTSKSKVVQPYDIPRETHAVIIKDVFSKQSEMLRSELKNAAKANISRWCCRDIGFNKVDEWINHWLQFEMIKMSGTPGTRSAKYRNNTI